MDFYDFLSPFFFLMDHKVIYQTFKTVFDHISKHLEARQKYSAARRIFNSLLGVWKCGQTRSFVFDISFMIYMTFKLYNCRPLIPKTNTWLYISKQMAASTLVLEKLIT